MAEWVCGKCRSINNPGASSCYSCATPRHLAEMSEAQLSTATSAATVGSPSAAVPATYGEQASGGFGRQLDVSPAAALPSGVPLTSEGALAGATEIFAPAVPQRPSNLVGGLLAGIAAAAVATIAWFAVVTMTEYQIGFVAAGIGWLVGFAVVFGAGGRASLPLVAASAVLTLLALAISEYMIYLHFASQFFGVELALADFIQPPDLVIELILESLQADPVTLLFWAIALFGAVMVPFRSISPQES